MVSLHEFVRAFRSLGLKQSTLYRMFSSFDARVMRRIDHETAKLFFLYLFMDRIRSIDSLSRVQVPGSFQQKRLRAKYEFCERFIQSIYQSRKPCPRLRMPAAFIPAPSRFSSVSKAIEKQTRVTLEAIAKEDCKNWRPDHGKPRADPEHSRRQAIELPKPFLAVCPKVFKKRSHSHRN